MDFLHLCKRTVIKFSDEAAPVSKNPRRGGGVSKKNWNLRPNCHVESVLQAPITNCVFREVSY